MLWPTFDCSPTETVVEVFSDTVGRGSAPRILSGFIEVSLEIGRRNSVPRILRGFITVEELDFTCSDLSTNKIMNNNIYYLCYPLISSL